MKAFIFIFHVLCLIASAEAKEVSKFAKLKFENAKALNAVRSTVSVSSLLQCVQFCMRKDNCFGVNFQHNTKSCEMIKKKILDLENAEDWSVFMFQDQKKAVCQPNPCLNGGECRALSDNTFNCTCSKSQIGEMCEKDFSFELDITAPDSYIEIPITFSSLREFTFCVKFQGSLDENYRTVFNYFSSSGGTCSNIRLDVRKGNFLVRMFHQEIPIGHKPNTTAPFTACISWRNTQYEVYLDDVLVTRSEGSYVYLLNSGTLTLGFPYFKYTNCKRGSSNDSKFVGKISSFFLYNHFFGLKDALNFGKQNWGKKSSMILSWDEFRHKKYHYGNVVEQMKT